MLLAFHTDTSRRLSVIMIRTIYVCVCVWVCCFSNCVVHAYVLGVLAMVSWHVCARPQLPLKQHGWQNSASPTRSAMVAETLPSAGACAPLAACMSPHTHISGAPQAHALLDATPIHPGIQAVGNGHMRDRIETAFPRTPQSLYESVPHVTPTRS